MILGVDVGGTFTDLAGWDGARLRTTKVPTTADQSDGVVAGAGSLTTGPLEALLHGTTVATNALLEGRGARTALVTSAGFADVIEIGRQDRPSLYDPAADRPPPLVDRELRFEVEGSQADLDEVAAAVAAASPEAVAICLLHSYADGRDEAAVERAVAARLHDTPIAASSRVAPEFREYERTATAVLNAYLAPATSSYLARLVGAARAAGIAADVAVMRSSGGLLAAAQAAALPAAVLLSGPTGGVVAAATLGEALGHARLVSFDMGGTSTDVCRITGGRPEVAYGREVAGYPCQMPAVAVHTVGAGGGSVAWVDGGGALRVGPRSAGAAPGPASYGRGGAEPTVTDANLVLGRLGSASRLGGSVALRRDLADRALAALGDALDMDVATAAAGVVEVVEAHMTRAVRRVSVEEGADPRDAVLVAFGGAGGLHATALARRLEMQRVIVPPYAGVFSALGLLLSPPRADASRSVLPGAADAALDRAIAEVADQARADLAATGATGPVEVATLVDARYRGQSHETVVPYGPGDGRAALKARFHTQHEVRNGFARPGDPVEVVTVRAVATAPPALRWTDLPSPRPSGEAARPGREVVTRDGLVEAAVWWRPALEPGAELVGPCVVEEPEATTYLAPGERARVLEHGVLEVEW